MPVVSTMGLGIDRSGRVERYQPPKVIEEGGGGSPPFVSDALSSPPFSGPLGGGLIATPLTTLAVPAGEWLVWATITAVNVAAAGITFSLTGAVFNNFMSQATAGNIAATSPETVTGPATLTVGGGNSVLMTAAPVTGFETQIFARKIGE